MGLDCSGRSIVGFRINKTDFYKDDPTGEYVCRSGHTFTSEMPLKFCSDCGQELEPKTKRTFTPRLLDYCKRQLFDPDGVITRWEDDFRNAHPHFCIVSQVYFVGGSRDNILTLGLCILETKSHRSGHLVNAKSMTSAELQTAFETMEDLANSLGYSRTEVRLYQALRASA